MAFYNNNFPATYQQYYPQAYQAQAMANQQVNQQQANSGIIWVQGEAGAKSYLVAPNMTVQLWDSENPVIYLKSADASGMPSIKVLDYTVRGSQGGSQPFNNGQDKYISLEQFDGLKNELEALRNEVERMKANRIKAHKKEGGNHE